MSVVRGVFCALSYQIWIRIKIWQPSYFVDCMRPLSLLIQAEVKFFCQYLYMINGHPLFFGWGVLSTSLCGLQTKYDA